MADESPLCCCEYYNLNNQRTHLLSFCCECDDFDKVVDDWFKGNPQTLERFSKIINSFTDRCRLPWVGGAQQFDTGVFFPPFILIVATYIACIHFMLTVLVFLALPVVVLCFYVITIRVKMKTRFFLSLSLTSTVGLFLIYFYYVAPYQPFITNILLITSAAITSICFYGLQKRHNTHYTTTSLPTYNNKSINQARPANCSTFCEDCGESILPRAKHCRICKECVSRYDHHCVWTNCCIGGHNHRLFLCTIMLYLINIAAGCYITLSHICGWSLTLLPNCSHVYASERLSLVFVCCCYALLCGVALLILLLQQIILITFNITSYELRHISSPDQHTCWDTLTSSRYNKGFLNNWREFLKI